MSSHNHENCVQNIKQLEQEIDYLNKKYTITNAERLNYQQRLPSFKVSPYHVKLYEQMKNLNDSLRRELVVQQAAFAEEDKGYDVGRLIGTENDLIIQRLRQHIYEYEMKIKEYKILLESQKQSVYGLKNRPFLKKEIMTENYGQLKRANDILTQEVIDKVRQNQDLEMELMQLKRQYQIVQLPVQKPVFIPNP